MDEELENEGERQTDEMLLLEMRECSNLLYAVWIDSHEPIGSDQEEENAISMSAIAGMRSW